MEASRQKQGYVLHHNIRDLHSTLSLSIRHVLIGFKQISYLEMDFAKWVINVVIYTDPEMTPSPKPFL